MGFGFVTGIRPCRNSDWAAILAIVNAAAEAYRGLIPADQWREPYMSREELEREVTSGVMFWGCEEDCMLIGVMGLQTMRDVDLIRHAYVLPGSQRHGIGSALLNHLESFSNRRKLVGTWQAASWAIRFYQRHGFEMVAPTRKDLLLKTYWNVPDRQIETSVVLANPRLEEI